LTIPDFYTKILIRLKSREVIDAYYNLKKWEGCEEGGEVIEKKMSNV